MNTADIAKTLGTLLGRTGRRCVEGRRLHAESRRRRAASIAREAVGGRGIGAHADGLLHCRARRPSPLRPVADESLEPGGESVRERRLERELAEDRRCPSRNGGSASPICAPKPTRWLGVVRAPRDVDEIELNGMIGSIAHLAYHLGAIRQINQSTRGPADGGRVESRK